MDAFQIAVFFKPSRLVILVLNERIKIRLHLGDACHQLNQKHLISPFIPKNMFEGFGCFLYRCEYWFILLRGKQVSQKNVYTTMLGLRGMSVERAAGLQSCIPYRNFEKMKLNI
jgi:hypothetical protein